MKTKRIMRLVSMTLVAIANLGFFSCSSDDGDDNGNQGYGGHAYVDLGLPSGIKWAACNIGASSPSDYGYYFAWGETRPKSTYTMENSKTWEKGLGEISGNSKYDAARANWGGSWRLPSEAEFEELKLQCTWTWMNGSNGYKIIGPNGNSIFLPAAGYRNGSSLNTAGGRGFYWSSTPYESGTQNAYGLYFFRGYHSVYWYSRDYGRAVRPVSE
ncbi:MAG: DUF1566 domain-containing protein [Bacteroidaceae bacterium]|nr:DUF1566 domain-containing protein [Bacteroidaceae bacterium]